ncbi:hypothetical protein [Sinorhizobium mexicanum]|uniref:REase AHJR-like domain-containing protein n=1 Tax=Sinorhizobium mexicanum TaxID=375549 RepID=A0A859QVB7_9HYPH|nr:hypothetical protein [Sinorhizobium mexicanum]MBP1885716.1 hypothetical protein [Sinorhizobium mexicanum]QLL63479.1 hypothetical protein FKV68_19545 [Sinorhizobium mexicanum]
MKPESSSREAQRASELAIDYRNKGFQVSIPSSPAESPEFLRRLHYIPDIIARSAEENLVIAVKSRETMRDLANLSEVAELINSQPGWKFVVVFTNPREPSNVNSRSSAEKVSQLLEKSEVIAGPDAAHLEASFLFAWAALEASLRLLPETRKSEKNPSTPWTLIRDAAMAGHIGRDEAQSLGRLLKIRNSILHAGNESPPQASDVHVLRRVAEEVVQVATRQR